jgi:hypothetical protein
MIFNMVAGGAALNFKIIGGTVQPENPMENTIWVDTNVEITGWHFGTTAPENPVPGMVWIHTGTSSNAGFNALKKNGIMVYPLSAKQHIDGAWVSKTAESWQNGNWVDWFPFLYNRGDECIDLTGGWVSRSWEMAENAGSASQTYSIEKNDDYLKFTKTGQVGAVMHTAHKIDLSKVKAIHFKGEMMGGDTYGNWVGFYVWPNLSGRYWNSNAVAKVDGDKAAIKTEFTLDVSSLEPGEYYVGFGIYDPINHVKLEELYLEVT